MIKHIVMFKLKEASDENIKSLQNSLLGLKEEIDQLIELEVGINYNDSPRAMDIVLITLFSNKADLEAYQVHPSHLPVVEKVKQMCIESRVVDYEG